MNDPLLAIDKLLAEMPNEGPPEEDEFTLYEYMDVYNKRHKVNLSTSGANRHLKNMLKDGLVTMRKGRLGGKIGNIYKLVTNSDTPQT
jgi:hypothetical protein